MSSHLLSTAFRGLSQTALKAQLQTQVMRSRSMSSYWSHLARIDDTQRERERPDRLSDFGKANESRVCVVTDTYKAPRLDDLYYKSSTPEFNESKKNDEDNTSNEEEPRVTDSLRFDDLFYKPMEQDERQYAQTWVEFPYMVRKLNAMQVYDSEDGIAPPLEKRDPRECPLTARPISDEAEAKFIAKQTGKNREEKRLAIVPPQKTQQAQQRQQPQRCQLPWRGFY